jgi:hypothetical protein
MKNRLITFVMALLLATSAVADSGGNSVYIDQTNADQSTVSITQTGSNNTVGDPNNIGSPAFVVDGNTMDLTIVQDGMNNSITGNFVGGNSTASINQTGNTNTSVLNMGNFGTGTGLFNLGIAGSNNSTTLNIGTTSDAGQYNFATTLTGDSNTIVNNINSKKTDNSIVVTGNTNNITTTQTGNGGSNSVRGHAITSTVVGNNNTLNVQQTGVTNANSVTVNVTGSDTTTNIIQH